MTLTHEDHREELFYQLEDHKDKKLRIIFVDYSGVKDKVTEMELVDVKYENDEIVVEVGRK